MRRRADEERSVRPDPGRVPEIEPAPEWAVGLIDADRRAWRVHESLLTLGDGRHAVRGTPSDPTTEHRPLVAVNGVYTQAGSAAETLLAGAGWTQLEATRPVEAPPRLHRRVLDLRGGVLLDEDLHEPRRRVLRFLSLARPGLGLLRAEDPTHQLDPVDVPTPPDQDGTDATDSGTDDAIRWMRVSSPVASVLTATHTEVVDGPTHRVVDRVAVVAGNGVKVGEARDRIAEARSVGFDGLLAEHRAAWAGRWADADVVVEGEPRLQQAIRFSLFHLMASVPSSDEATVGARGLSGLAYRGHVFWDADVHVLPFLAATHPPAARAMLEYRVRRLRQARARAAARGFEGAAFPWESASRGDDVTPTQITLPSGEVLPVRTGQYEEHITADVAWAASHYVDWTGDTAFLEGPGRPLVVDTARYWAARIRLDTAGRAHLDEVIGPDEYHERVDDNMFTNVLARWNLRRGAELVGPTDPARAAAWRRLADALVDGYDSTAGVHEQFAGYHQLTPLYAADIQTPPFAADLVLGRDRVQASQLIKQADVVLAHHLLPDELTPGSMARDLDHYLPRTSHGSSLSPAIHAAVLARTGRPDEALRWLRLAARLDLEDLTGGTATGLHVAAMGGVWQALAMGFLGLRPTHQGLRIDPHLPDAWEALELRCRVRGRRVHVRAQHDVVQVSTDGPVDVVWRGKPRAVDGDWASRME